MKSTLIDLTGETFGNWYVIKRAPNRGKAVRWFCKCGLCGSIVNVAGTSLKSGTSKNCTCIRKTGLHRTHGLSNHPLYRVWQRMKGCTSSPTHQDYKHYGERGIVVCEEWREDFGSFYEWAMTHGYQRGLTIERIDVDGNYEPSNCTWIPQSEQPKNSRRTRWYRCESTSQT